MNGIKQTTIVTGTIGDDIHSLGIKVIEHALSAAGFKVAPLGIQTSQEDFIRAAMETDAAAILVSSLSGHARMLCGGFREKCVEAGLTNIILYLGGNLTTGDTSWGEIEPMFLNMGYDRAYPSSTLPGRIIADLQADMAAKHNKDRVAPDHL